MRTPFEPPEAWARPFIETVRGALSKASYRGATTLFAAVYSSIAAGHITGLDYFYEYAIEAYYEAAEEGEEAGLLAEPRWKLELMWVEEEAGALAEFEERLADSSTVYCAEPLLAAAIHGYRGLGVGGEWFSAGYSGQQGEKIVLVETGGKRCKIALPGSLYALAVAGLSSLKLTPTGTAELVVADPAWVRRRVYESHVAYGELAGFLDSLIRGAVNRALSMSVRDVCGDEIVEGVLALRYRLQGPSRMAVDYLC